MKRGELAAMGNDELHARGEKLGDVIATHPIKSCRASASKMLQLICDELQRRILAAA
jgi:hypothetical protein